MSRNFALPLSCVRFALLFLCPWSHTTGRDGSRGSRSPLPGTVEPSLVFLAARAGSRHAWAQLGLFISPCMGITARPSLGQRAEGTAGC